jgi:hypothetical protein
MAGPWDEDKKRIEGMKLNRFKIGRQGNYIKSDPEPLDLSHKLAQSAIPFQRAFASD